MSTSFMLCTMTYKRHSRAHYFVIEGVEGDGDVDDEHRCCSNGSIELPVAGIGPPAASRRPDPLGIRIARASPALSISTLGYHNVVVASDWLSANLKARAATSINRKGGSLERALKNPSISSSTCTTFLCCSLSFL